MKTYLSLEATVLVTYPTGVQKRFEEELEDYTYLPPLSTVERLQVCACKDAHAATELYLEHLRKHLKVTEESIADYDDCFGSSPVHQYLNIEEVLVGWFQEKLTEGWVVQFVSNH